MSGLGRRLQCALRYNKTFLQYFHRAWRACNGVWRLRAARKCAGPVPQERVMAQQCPLTMPWSECAHPTRHKAATWQQGQSQGRWPVVVGSLSAASESNVLVARQAAVHAHPRVRGRAARGWRADFPPVLSAAVARQAQRVIRQALCSHSARRSASAARRTASPDRRYTSPVRRSASPARCAAPRRATSKAPAPLPAPARGPAERLTWPRARLPPLRPDARAPGAGLPSARPRPSARQRQWPPRQGRGRGGDRGAARSSARARGRTD